MELQALLTFAEDHPWVWIVVLIYGCLNIYVKVRSAPTKKEGWQNVLNELAQRISVTDWKGGKAVTLPGAGSGTASNSDSA